MTVHADFAHNIDFVGWTDQGGRSDGLQIMVDKGYAYIGNMFSEGVSIIDVRDPRAPRAAEFIKAPPGTWNLHLQLADDLLLVVNAADLFAAADFASESNYYGGAIADGSHNGGLGEFAAGMTVYDVSTPGAPRKVSFMPVDGLGLHRLWYTGGRWAYGSAHFTGFIDYIFVVIDMQNPSAPQIVGRWWIPGQNAAAGETPTWDTRRWRYGLHHAVIAGDHAFGAWRDGGMTILDITDKTAPSLVVHHNWSPPFNGGTHSMLPLLDRDLLVAADEGVADNAADGIKRIWLFDIRERSRPISIATLPTPAEADYVNKGGHFGPHNMHENRPGSFVSSDLVFATYQNAGVRVFDIKDPYRPAEVGAWVPPKPRRLYDSRPGRPLVIQSADVFVDRNGLMYLTDYNAGLYILQYTPA